MLKKIYQELTAIRTELQAMNKRAESKDAPVSACKPYSTTYAAHVDARKTDSDWFRFELLTEGEDERVRLEETIAKHDLSRQDLAVILFGLRVRPEFGKKDFGI